MSIRPATPADLRLEAQHAMEDGASPELLRLAADAWDADIQKADESEERVQLLGQRVTFEAAWRVADSDYHDYTLACYMLRDLPLSEAAGMKDLLWALHNSGYAAKGDWQMVRDAWDEAYRSAFAEGSK